MNSHPAQCQCQQAKKYYNASGVEGYGFAHQFSRPTFLKFLKSTAGQKCSSAAETSRIIGSSNTSLVFKTQAFEIRGMNGSCAVSAWSGSCPSMKSLAIHQDRERESVINILNFLPTNQKFIKWVGNHQAFIVKNNFRSNKNQMRSVASETGPSQSSNGVSNGAIQQREQRNHAGGDVDRSSIEKITSGAKQLRISHPPIVPQAMGAAY